MTLTEMPCGTCGLHHRNRDFVPVCLNALKARVAELEAALDEATDLLAMVGTEPLDKFRALIRPLNLPPKAAQILADNLENFS